MKQEIVQLDEESMYLLMVLNGELLESLFKENSRVIRSLPSPIPVVLGSKRIRRRVQ